MKSETKEFFEKAEIFINRKIRHSFHHKLDCNICRDDLKEIVKFIAHELRLYASNCYLEAINSLEKDKTLDETFKKKTIESLRFKESEFEIIVIRALEDWGIVRGSDLE
jgi:hypothetical protein